MLKSKKYAWVICILGSLAMFCSMGICSNMLSYFLPYIEQTGISHSVGSSLISIRCAFSLIALFFINRYYKLLGLRKGLFFSMLFVAASSALYSISDSALMYQISTAVGGIGYALGGLVPVAILIKKWFKDRLGVAMAIATLGSSLASVVLPPVMEKVLHAVGLSNTYLVITAFASFVSLLMIILLRNDPRDIGLEPYTDQSNAKIKTLNFNTNHISNLGLVLVLITLFLTCGVAQSGTGHLSVLAETRGYGGDIRSLMVSTFGLCSILAKLVFGEIADYFSTKRASQLMFTICILGCFMSFFLDGESIWPCFVTSGLIGFGFAVTTVGVSLWAVELNDISSYERTLKLFQIIIAIGGIVLGLVPGFIYEHFGDYRLAYEGFGILVLISGICLTLAYRRELGK